MVGWSLTESGQSDGTYTLCVNLYAAIVWICCSGGAFSSACAARW